MERGLEREGLERGVEGVEREGLEREAVEREGLVRGGGEREGLLLREPPFPSRVISITPLSPPPPFPPP